MVFKMMAHLTYLTINLPHASPPPPRGGSAATWAPKPRERCTFSTELFIHAWFQVESPKLKIGILEKNNYITVSMFPANKKQTSCMIERT